MTTRDQALIRLTDRVHLEVLAEAFVVIIGAGSVGSAVALELAKCGIGSMALIDGDELEPANLSRHVLTQDHLGANKAEGMADALSSFPGLNVGALNRHIDGTLTDVEVDTLLWAADLVIIATDDRQAQRRLAERTLALDQPAIVPALYPGEHGGEVFVQLGPSHPCLLCWDAFRPPNGAVRAVSAINADALDVIQQTVYLSLAVLDPELPEARDLAPSADDPRPRQVFVLRAGAPLVRAPLDRNPECLACRTGPSSLTGRRRSPDHNRFRALLPKRRQVGADWSFMLSTVELPGFDELDVDATLVLEGAPVTISWRTRHASYVEIDGRGRLATSGELQVVVSEHTAYTVRAISPLGSTTALTPPVRVMRLPDIPTVTLTPLTPGEPVAVGDVRVSPGRAFGYRPVPAPRPVRMSPLAGLRVPRRPSFGREGRRP